MPQDVPTIPHHTTPYHTLGGPPLPHPMIPCCYYIVSLSFGHQCDNNISSGVKTWGIVGIGLMPWDSKMFNILKKQDTLYTLLSRGHTGSEARVVGSMIDFMFAPQDHQAVIDKVTLLLYHPVPSCPVQRRSQIISYRKSTSRVLI